MPQSALVAVFVLFSTWPCLAWTHGSQRATQFATRAIVASSFNSGFFQGMSRTGHFARSTVSDVAIIVPNFYVDPNAGETGSGATATVTASIEYPAGVCTPLTFNGSAGTSIADGQMVRSDFVSLAIPSGDQFWVRQYWKSSGGLVLVATNDNATMGDTLDAGQTGIGDKTVSCASIANNNVGPPSTIFPLAILTNKTQTAACILGDSIAINNAADNSNGDGGVIQPSIGPTIPYISLAISSDSAHLFTTTNRANTIALLPYCSAGIVQYGRNDLDPGNLATFEADLTTIYGHFASWQQVFQTTITPISTSTDSWATTVNQTALVTQTNNFNAVLRGGTFGPVSGYFDVASAVETSISSGIWKATGSAFGYTLDGTHPSGFGDQQVQSSGVIDTSRIHYP